MSGQGAILPRCLINVLSSGLLRSKHCADSCFSYHSNFSIHLPSHLFFFFLAIYLLKKLEHLSHGLSQLLDFTAFSLLFKLAILLLPVCFHLTWSVQVSFLCWKESLLTVSLCSPSTPWGGAELPP